MLGDSKAHIHAVKRAMFTAQYPYDPFTAELKFQEWLNECKMIDIFEQPRKKDETV